MFCWGLWHGTRTRLKNAVKIFITEPFDSCHEVRDGNAMKADPKWLFPGDEYGVQTAVFPAQTRFLRYPVISPGSARIESSHFRWVDFDLRENMGSSCNQKLL
jgi:hypothetical protein